MADKVKVTVRNENPGTGSRVVCDLDGSEHEIKAGETKELEVSSATADNLKEQSERDDVDLKVVSKAEAKKQEAAIEKAETEAEKAEAKAAEARAKVAAKK